MLEAHTSNRKLLMSGRIYGINFPNWNAMGSKMEARPVSARCRPHHFAGIRIGAPLSFTKNTKNFADSVLLAFRPTK